LQERYVDDPLTHPECDPNLWLKVESSNGLDRKQVYGISNTAVEDMYRSLAPRNRVWAPNLQSSRQLYKNKLKLRLPSLMLRQPNLDPRWPNFGDCTRICCQASVVHVVYPITHLIRQRSTSTFFFFFSLCILDKLYSIIFFKLIIKFWFFILVLFLLIFFVLFISIF
jgi:hypothetical protein